MIRKNRNIYSSYGSDEKERRKLTMCKRVLYILRYGAQKENLRLFEGDYVKVDDLRNVQILKYYKLSELLTIFASSVGNNGTKRFETKIENHVMFVRATYGRRMERNPCHEDSNVLRLLDICLSKVTNNLKDYDLEDFPDEFLLNTMIHRLRIQKRLTNKALKSLLTPAIEHLDLGYVYLTEASLKFVGLRCPNLKVLNMRECGYVLTDHMMEILLKKVPRLESLNLSGCHHLTNRTVNAICKNLPNTIQQLNLQSIPNVTEESILELLSKCTALNHLDIFDNKNLTDSGREKIKELCTDRKLVVVLEGLELENDRTDFGDPSLSLHLAGVGNTW